ncbi:hypothetical protein T492DRAFT_988793 [Pavlovales sp. CCMP2436]|nr:hypothetical protein T492DRAFT_988793 [Pavlovales sp. CCMP2436]|mmetsp:Transcript_4438/g.11345  ORF Transcript_4438/g.11345 Transcript_4438/m.11345 type:complete len:175 (-) Transcript_4438:225-749(-)
MRLVIVLAYAVGARAQVAQAPAPGPWQQLRRAQQLVSPGCVGCVSQCASQNVGTALAQPAMRAITMFGYRHLFWNEQKECAEFGEGVGLVFRNLQLWHVGALFAHFYLQCARECHKTCPYWGQRGKVAAALSRREESRSPDWVYKLGPSYAWEHRFAKQKLEEEREAQAANTMR